MADLFKFSGMIGVVLVVFAAIPISYESGLLAVLFVFFGIVISLALIKLAEVIEYVEHLKRKNNTHGPGQLYSDKSLPQVKCPKCGITHDFDYPKCPSCGFKK